MRALDMACAQPKRQVDKPMARQRRVQATDDGHPKSLQIAQVCFRADGSQRTICGNPAIGATKSKILMQ